MFLFDLIALISAAIFGNVTTIMMKMYQGNCFYL
jgi:hypothetical protein